MLTKSADHGGYVEAITRIEGVQRIDLIQQRAVLQRLKVSYKPAADVVLRLV